ncbi:MAG: STAS domain-containing protein [Desulfuromonadaceae bacterium]|nr:STAS domain-containing protein [Desulfuromonadaceae bacterium]MDD2847954.1 STAS domain-containing protein [Desulfuromonadaceae bacterium]MDD4131304.1 STAS domain-containing protein [Desulfuromonadaceae bacterium]
MDRDNMHKIAFNGDLSMIGVTEQFPLMAQYVAGTIDVVSADSDVLPPLEIDLTGVDVLDACGCQLLVAFVRNIRKRGGGVVPCIKLTDSCRGTIHTLGFDDELLAGECA